LLERSLDLTRAYRLDMHLEAELTAALTGLDVARAIAVAEAAADCAVASQDEAAAALARTVVATVRLQTAESSVPELERLARIALPLLEAREDDDGLIHVWEALGWAANMKALYADWADAIEHLLVHARRAGHGIVGTRGLAAPLTVGPTPASEALARLDAHLADQPQSSDLALRGVLLAMLGRIDEAWTCALAANERLQELGTGSMGTSALAEIALIAGDLEVAAQYLRTTCQEFKERGATSHLASYAPLLSRALSALERPDEAEPLARLGREEGDPEDVWTQALWRQAEALVHSARGQHADAMQLAGEAVDWASRGDSLLRQGDAYCDLAQVLEAADRRDQAINVWHEALDRYGRKEIIPHVRRVRDRLAALQATQK
jgi:tetratricopeptide (TPR) repeat protein